MKKMINQYRKKPVVIDAVKFEYTVECLNFLKEWMGLNCGNVKKDRHPTALAELEIITLEDGQTHFTAKHIATEGDYIIKGVHGEFYACKPDIFFKTYEKAD